MFYKIEVLFIRVFANLNYGCKVTTNNWDNPLCVLIYIYWHTERKMVVKQMFYSETISSFWIYVITNKIKLLHSLHNTLIKRIRPKPCFTKWKMDQSVKPIGKIVIIANFRIHPRNPQCVNNITHTAGLKVLSWAKIGAYVGRKWDSKLVCFARPQKAKRKRAGI